MKIYWEKIPKCFTHAALLAGGTDVKVFHGEPKLCKPLNNRDGWDAYFVRETGIVPRLLILHEEYELDGTEDWKESLQQRCTLCLGNKIIDDCDKYIIDCPHCNGTGVEP